MSKELLISIRTVASATKYPVEAFLFVQRGLEFTVDRLHGEMDAALEAETPGDEDDETAHASRHVTGQQLCQGMRDLAIRDYGSLARAVLRRWRINSSEDFGRIVFTMIEARLMNKTEQDSIRDFVDVYDFDEAFAPPLQLSEN